MTMSELQIIEMLCSLAEQQAGVIHHLVMELEQARALSDADRELVNNAQQEYADILGTNEFSDNC